ncbi:hypothetical protein HMPREF0027_2287 [Actinobacillus ureae ATCC 25976]|uniref:Uncharacterized protein n=1 Tax=Actinobacillus ureae ATCC 25976 TaxID=887324 RepID=E8KKC0_9PAST|nr:hypothetical protein HMPREF0027_2287 [Actinobacillus ureae ATCC 25976]
MIDISFFEFLLQIKTFQLATIFFAQKFFKKKDHGQFIYKS